MNLDDVIITSKTVTEHLSHVREVLQLPPNAGVTLELAECTFFDTAVSYLGHTIRPGQLVVDTRHLVAIKQATPRTNNTKLWSFLGMCNVYRRFFLTLASQN